ncbi:YceI family protein [Mucilaginibacter sp.]|uniref:YceI family protein n=1 Tax=Mucilaginibacter sp. TaxID=1882438 RepID=UPI003D10F90C
MKYQVVLMILFSLIDSMSQAQTNKWVVMENSTLSVNGSTNVNKFACDVLKCDKADTLTIYKSKKEITLSGCVSLKVLSFDCHKDMMTHDLRKTLKANQFPYLQIRFLSIITQPQLTEKPSTVTGMVEIEIAGVRKRFDVNYQIAIDAEGVICLMGSNPVKFSDFDLVPPKKLGGLVKAKDQLSVAFELRMKAIM